jgi:hypothetical protein
MSMEPSDLFEPHTPNSFPSDGLEKMQAIKKTIFQPDIKTCLGMAQIEDDKSTSALKLSFVDALRYCQQYMIKSSNRLVQHRLTIDFQPDK